MINEFFQYCLKHPEAVAIIIVAIAGVFHIKRAKRKEVSISVQSDIMKTVVDLLAQSKIRLPKMAQEVENLLVRQRDEKDEDKKRDIGVNLTNKKNELSRDQKAVTDRLEEYIHRLEVVGSSRIRSWIADKQTSSLNGVSPWLTQANIDELILIIRIELGILSSSERVRYAIKNWLNRK